MSIRRQSTSMKGRDAGLAEPRGGMAAISKSEMFHLKQAVRQLQKESEEQLGLEQESQATFEFLNSQVGALRTAFTTLADVVMEEVDAIRSESRRRLKDLEVNFGDHVRAFKDCESELSLVRRTVDVWAMKERDWAKDNEIFKVSHAHNLEWMQQLQREMVELREQVHEHKQSTVGRTATLAEDTAGLRRDWEQHVEALQAKMHDVEVNTQRQREDLRAHEEQRMDDLELLEKALSTVQQQQVRLRQSVDDNVQAVSGDAVTTAKKVESLQNTLSACKLDAMEMRQAIRAQERDARQRFDNVSRVFKVFADALHIAPPLFAGIHNQARGGGGNNA